MGAEQVTFKTEMKDTSMNNATKALALIFVVAVLMNAQATGASGSTSARKLKATAAAAKAAPAPQAMTIPKDAVANPDGTYTWTDKQGKKWLYSQSPFGVIRSEMNAAPSSASLAGVRAFDEGDKVRFEKTSPFGPVKWEKNKSDLTDDERNLLNSETAQQNAKQD